MGDLVKFESDGFGIEGEIDGSAPCTYDDRRFPSHRRDVTHEGRSSTGRLHTLVRPGQPATSETC